jgi:ribosomal protein S18 acetylase RimI-like enzyme
MIDIAQLDSAAARAALPQLEPLLINVVDDGASIGFLAPMMAEEAHAYWQGRTAAIDMGVCALLVARDAAEIVGVVLLALEPRANGSHRAEVQKLMVHTDYRRRGIGRQLMAALEAVARENQRTLLFLDTREGDPSNVLYQELGYIYAGLIPQYARSSSGELHGTVFYYKILT